VAGYLVELAAADVGDLYGASDDRHS